MKWEKELEDELAILYKNDKTYKEIAEALDLRLSQVRHKISTLGLAKNEYKWTEDQERMLIDAYLSVDYNYELMLDELAKKLDRLKSNVCRKAKQLGLTNNSRKKLPIELQKIRQPKFATKEELSKHISERTKNYLSKNGHPKGALGMKHTEETKKKISKASTENNAKKTRAEKTASALKAQKTKIANGTQITNRQKTTWKGGWREIGGKRKFFRSRWEANYARYLESMKISNLIQDWQHEPNTFWFEGVKRGAVSYLPDFLVTCLDGSQYYVEVKGWMDSRSKTKLRRMAKYHPTVVLILVDSKEYLKLEKEQKYKINDWEI